MSTTEKTMTLGLDSQLIEVTEHEPGYFLGTLAILGTPHHFEMIEVVEVNEGLRQEPRCETDDGDPLENNNVGRYEELMAHSEGDPLCTVEFDGRQFVCIITPYCS